MTVHDLVECTCILCVHSITMYNAFVSWICFAALFYYTLGNISPMYRSTMRCIQLLAITKTVVLESYGADHILHNVMEDVKQLEQASYIFIISI